MDGNYKGRDPGTVLFVTEETGSTPFTTGNNDGGQLQLLFSGNRHAATLSSDTVYDNIPEMKGKRSHDKNGSHENSRLRTLYYEMTMI